MIYSVELCKKTDTSVLEEGCNMPARGGGDNDAVGIIDDKPLYFSRTFFRSVTLNYYYYFRYTN
jgi:hypothetical protein